MVIVGAVLITLQLLGLAVGVCQEGKSSNCGRNILWALSMGLPALLGATGTIITARRSDRPTTIWTVGLLLLLATGAVTYALFG